MKAEDPERLKRRAVRKSLKELYFALGRAALVVDCVHKAMRKRKIYPRANVMLLADVFSDVREYERLASKAFNSLVAQE